MKFFAYLVTIIFLSILSGIAIFFYGLWYFGKDLPDYKELSKYNPNVVTRIHAGNGALLAEFATQKRVFIPISVIPKKVINDIRLVFSSKKMRTNVQNGELIIIQL